MTINIDHVILGIGVFLTITAVIARFLFGIAMRHGYDNVAYISASLFCLPLFALGIYLILGPGT